MSYSGGRLEDMLHKLIQIGTVRSTTGGSAVVDFGGADSAELASGAQRMGGVKVWAPLSVGEQVLVLCPGGDPALGVVVCSLPSEANAAPSSDGAAYRAEFPDGTVVEHAGGVTTISCSGKVLLNAPLVEVPDGDVVAGGISLRNHVHQHGDPAGVTAKPS